jgi:hypothetical protein
MGHVTLETGWGFEAGGCTDGSKQCNWTAEGHVTTNALRNLKVCILSCFTRELQCISICFSVLDPHALNLSHSCRQNEGITYLDADVRELNYRVKGANDRGRQLLQR